MPLDVCRNSTYRRTVLLLSAAFGWMFTELWTVVRYYVRTCILCKSYICSPVPVSYTHLDVYKRQRHFLYHSLRIFRCTCRMSKVNWGFSLMFTCHSHSQVFKLLHLLQFHFPPDDLLTTIIHLPSRLHRFSSPDTSLDLVCSTILCASFTSLFVISLDHFLFSFQHQIFCISFHFGGFRTVCVLF